MTVAVRAAMPDRKRFLGAVSGAVGASLLATRAGAQTAPPSAPASAPAAPPAAPAPTPSGKPPSPLATAYAERMRRFDGALTDEELRTIAAGVDEVLGSGNALNPKGQALRNGDEPITSFRVAPERGA